MVSLLCSEREEVVHIQLDHHEVNEEKYSKTLIKYKTSYEAFLEELELKH